MTNYRSPLLTALCSALGSLALGSAIVPPANADPCRVIWKPGVQFPLAPGSQWDDVIRCEGDCDAPQPSCAPLHYTGPSGWTATSCWCGRERPANQYCDGVFEWIYVEPWLYYNVRCTQYGCPSLPPPSPLEIGNCPLATSGSDLCDCPNYPH